jgi:long-chain acyl-CoA synthetase
MFSLTALLSRASLINGTQPIVTEDGHCETWQSFQTRVDQMAGKLVSLGAQRGDRIGIFMVNSIRALELIFATARIGCTIVPINIRFAKPEILDCLTDCGVRFLFVQSDLWETVSGLDLSKSAVEELIFCPLVDGEEAIGSAQAFPHIDHLEQSPVNMSSGAGDELAAIFYTSGTTGRPKGVMLSHNGIVANELQWIAALGLSESDRLMVVAPMFHAAGALNAIGAVALGCGVHFMGAFNIDAMLGAIQAHKITKVGLIVVMLEMIGRHPTLTDYDLSSVRKISYGGSPISEKALAQAQKTFPNADLFQVYGQTEGGPTVSILPPECHQADHPKIRSAGKPVIGTSLLIADQEGRPLPSGEIGEICVSGPGVTIGYWDNEEETRKAFRNGLLRTGDAGYLDEAGFLFICDRVKDMIISGGENVYSSEVENALMKYPGMIECAAIGIPSDQWGEQVHAIVRLEKGAVEESDRIIAHCREWLAGYKLPRSVEFRTEPLPVSPSAKILKNVLRAPYWEKA